MPRPPFVLVVSSLRPQCGRTAVALRIAAAWAETRRVAFVDSDPARPTPDAVRAAFPKVRWMAPADPPDDVDAIVVDAPAGPPEPLPDPAFKMLVVCPIDAADDLAAFLAAATLDPGYRNVVGVLAAAPHDPLAAARQALSLRLRHGRRVLRHTLPHDPALPPGGAAEAACRSVAEALDQEWFATPFKPGSFAQKADRPLTVRAPRPADLVPLWQALAVAAIFMASVASFHWRAEFLAWAEQHLPALAKLAGNSG